MTLPTDPAQTMRAAQAGLRARYGEDPASALTALTAHGESSDERPTFTVTQWGGPARAGRHRATGGSGDDACSGDMLLEAVLACAGVTLRSAAIASHLTLRSVTGDATATFDARGTLGIDPSAPVGIQDLAVDFVVDAEASDEQLARLQRTVERYCVVGSSLAQPPRVTVRRAGDYPEAAS